MSPPLVIAFGLAGDAERDLRVDPVQVAPDGTPVYLEDLWPTREEVDEVLRASQDPADYQRAFAVATRNPLWHALEAPDTPLYPWDEASASSWSGATIATT